MRQWKVGRITLGIFLVGIGILLALNTVTNIPIDKILSLGWPILLIVLGIEVLAYQIFQKEGNWSFDGFSIFLLFVAASSVFVIYAVQSVGIIPFIKDNIMAQAYPIEIEKSMQVDDATKRLEIDIPNGDIQVIATKGNEIQVSGVLRTNANDVVSAEEFADQAFSMNKIGDKVVITLDSSINHFGRMPINVASLAIEVPEIMIINTKVINGKVEVKGFQQNVQIDGSNLAVDIEDITGNVFVKNTNGKIDIREVVGDIDATLTNGNVNVVSTAIRGDVSVRTVNGNVTVEMSDDEHVNIIANTTNGRVTQNFDDSSEKSFRYTLGEGTYTIDLKTTNGNVRLE